MEENILILTVGLPRSGKSTWSKASGHPVVNPDSIRLALHGNAFIPEAEPMVWAMAKYMVKALFLAGHSRVVLDATNTTIKRRNEWVDASWSRRFKVFDIDALVCRERAIASERLDLLPVIMRMSAQFEPLSGSEKALAL